MVIYREKVLPRKWWKQYDPKVGFVDFSRPPITTIIQSCLKTVTIYYVMKTWQVAHKNCTGCNDPTIISVTKRVYFARYVGVLPVRDSVVRPWESPVLNGLSVVYSYELSIMTQQL